MLSHAAPPRPLLQHCSCSSCSSCCERKEVFRKCIYYDLRAAMTANPQYMRAADMKGLALRSLWIDAILMYY